jgi:hypothetical protein
MRASGKGAGYNSIISIEDGKISLWINSAGITAEGVDKEVVFDINQKKVYGMTPANGDTLTIALREVDYCDTEGNQYKMLVLCSEPYTSS